METMTDVHGTSKWTWANIHFDLVHQGGLDSTKLLIDPASFKHDNFFVGEYDGNLFTVTWVRDAFLLVSMPVLAQGVIDAFSAVVEYKPFACYKRGVYTTTEWDRVDPGIRWAQLQDEIELRRIDGVPGTGVSR